MGGGWPPGPLRHRSVPRSDHLTKEQDAGFTQRESLGWGRESKTSHHIDYPTAHESALPGLGGNAFMEK